MKTKLPFFAILLAPLFFNAQSSDLLNTNWQITKIIAGGQTYLPPPMPYSQSTYFAINPGPSTINSSFFNTMSGTFVFNNSNSTFTKNTATCTLADYFGDSGQVNQFSGLNCDFFLAPNTGNFVYNLTSDGTGKQLVITNPLGNQIFYKAAILATENADVNKNKITVYPNPAKDFVTINNLDKNSRIDLLDAQGKLVLRVLTVNDKISKIDVSKLEAGVYFIKINKNTAVRFIK